MGIVFVNNGAFGATTASATVTLAAPVVTSGDILVAMLVAKDNQLTTPPTGWTKIQETTNTAAQICSTWWKRADSSDSAANFDFVKGANDGLFYGGIICAWTGCADKGSPIDAGTPSTSANASSDNVTYATFTPKDSAGLLVAAGFYNLSLTTAGSISGTNPVFTNRVDIESATVTTASIFVYDGPSTGNVATGARSHSTTSTVDDISVGVIFGLVPFIAQGSTTGSLYPSIVRSRGGFPRVRGR